MQKGKHLTNNNELILSRKFDKNGLVSKGLLASQVVPLATDPDVQEYYKLEKEENDLETAIRERDKGRLTPLQVIFAGVTGTLVFGDLLRRGGYYMPRE